MMQVYLSLQPQNENGHNFQKGHFFMSMKISKRKVVVVAGGLFALVSVAVAGQLQITHPAAGDTPPAGGTPPADLYVAISKYKAANDGVNFGASQTTQHGQVTAWRWNFANGTPSTSSQQNPGVVKFSAAASYGNRNACTVNLAHTSTDENGQNQLCTPLTGLPVATININVVKPNLVFNTTGTGHPDDDALAQAKIDYSFTQLGTTCNYIITPYRWIGCPYEYVFTVAGPSNSGANSDDFAIYETNVYTETYKKEASSIQSDLVSVNSIPFATYDHSYRYIAYPSVTAPTNPKMYAADIPSIRKIDIESVMDTRNDNYYICTAGLSSTPLYQDPSHQYLDPDLLVEHAFTYICIRTPASSASKSAASTFDWYSTAQ